MGEVREGEKPREIVKGKNKMSNSSAVGYTTMDEEEEEDVNTVLFNTFLISNKRCRVYFRRNILMWEMEHSPYERQTVPVVDIIAVNCGTGNSENQAKSRTPGLCDAGTTSQTGSESSVAYSNKSLVIHYAKAGNDNKWTVAKVTLHHRDPRQVASWLLTLENSLKLLNRPKSFLVFVNPYCGKRKGNSIYKRSVKPVLDLARVDVHVIVTEYSNHAREVVLTTDLSKYDGILAVGGDGTLSEIVNALVLRTVRDSSGNENDCDFDIPKVRTPIAVIPGGSTDCIAYCLNGTRDRRTAAIYAVLGTLKGMDVCSVHSDTGLTRYFLSVLAYGFLGDVLKESEKHRWMGPRRYEYAGFLKVLRNRRYHCEVNMTLTPRSSGFKSRCYRYCGVCEDTPNGLSHNGTKVRYQEENLNAIRNDLKLFEVEESEPKKMTVRGKFFLISCANISCACKRSPNGIAPYGHLGDGCIDVLLFKPESITDILKLLLRSGSKRESDVVPDLPFVDSYKATEISFRVLDRNMESVSGDRDKVDSSVWNCDGEIVTEPNVRIKNCRQLVKMFTRRPQQTCGDSSVSSCFGCGFCSKNIV